MTLTAPTRAGWRPGAAVGSLWRRWNDAERWVAPARSQWPITMRRARHAGLALIAAQLVFLVWLSVLMVERDALSWDFSSYDQAAWLIAHGHLDPLTSLTGHRFLDTDGEAIIWPLAIFERIWPHPITLKVLQALAVAAGEAIAFGWICELGARRAIQTGRVRAAAVVVLLGALLLALDPWLTYTVAWDVHTEALAVALLIAAARDAYRGRRRAWWWVLALIASGTAPASYAAALGIALMLSGRRWWRQGLIMVVAGLGWLVVLHALGAANGASSLYGALVEGPDGAGVHGVSSAALATALVEHPGRFTAALGSNAGDFWATVSPLGLVGCLWLPALIPSAVILAEGGLVKGHLFAFPGFQTAALAPLIAVGTVALGLAALHARRRPVRTAAAGVLVLVAVNAVAWAVIWLPRTESRWLRVSPSSAQVLARLHAAMSSRDEVVASQGVSGGFSDRQWLYSLLGARSTIAVHARHVYFVFAPNVGLETASVAGIRGDMAQVAALPGSHLIVARDGIWAFEWTPRAATTRLALGSAAAGADAAQVPVWSVHGVAGRAVTSGPASSWTVTSTGEAGYVLDRAYWREAVGRYTASVTLTATAGADIEVWNDTLGELIARRPIDATGGLSTISMPFNIKRAPVEQVFEGWGPWRAQSSPVPAGDLLEIRVYSPGGSDRVTVRAASLRSR